MTNKIFRTKAQNKEEAAGLLSVIGKLIFISGVIHLEFFSIASRNPLPIVDVIIFIMLGHAIRRHQSRMASIILIVTGFNIIAGVVSIIAPVINSLPDISFNVLGFTWADVEIILKILVSMGFRIMWGSFIVCVGFKAYDNSVLYHSFAKSRLRVENVAIKSVLAFVYGAIISRIGIFIFSLFVSLGEATLWSNVLSQVVELSCWSVGAFMVFHGWLPLAKNRPLC